MARGSGLSGIQGWPTDDTDPAVYPSHPNRPLRPDTGDSQPRPCTTCRAHTPDAAFCDDCGMTICDNCQPMHPCHDRPRSAAVTPRDFTIDVTQDGVVTLVCPHVRCVWSTEIVRFEVEYDERHASLRWALNAASDHLDDQEANHGGA